MRLSRSRQIEDSSEIDMTPMIDIIFQLIIFFLMFSSFVEEEPAMKTELPVADQVKEIALDNAVQIHVPVYDINDTPTYFLTGDGLSEKAVPMKMAELKPKLAAWWTSHQVGQAPPQVLVVMDKHTCYEAYIYLRNMMMELKIRNFYCKVKKPE